MILKHNYFKYEKISISNYFPRTSLQGAAASSRLLQVRVLVGQHLAEGGHKVAHEEGAVLEEVANYQEIIKPIFSSLIVAKQCDQIGQFI